MKKKTWILVLIITIVVIIVCIFTMMQGKSDIHLKQDQEVRDSEANTIMIEERTEQMEQSNVAPTESVATTVEELDPEENKEPDTIQPTIISVEQGENKDTITMSGIDGEKMELEVGVVESEEEIPDAPNSSNVTINASAGEVTKETENDTSVIEEWKDKSDTVGQDDSITYLEYEAMSGQEQMIFYYSFANAEAFTEWYNNAKAEYEASLDKVYISDDGIVDAG